MSQNSKIAIIGAGNMGGAIARGLARHGYAVKVANRSAAKLDALKTEFSSIETTASNAEAAAGAAIVIVAVRPAQTPTVIAEIAPALAKGALVVTLAPSVELADIKLPDGVFAARMMPNTAIAAASSMTFVTFGDNVPDDVRAALITALDTIGSTAVIPEHLMGAATALCSCGLAYALRYIRASTEGGVAMGFPADDATRYVAATLRGAADLLEATGRHPEQLIDSVTTPGGTTIRGLIAMEKGGFTAAVIDGLIASSHE